MFLYKKIISSIILLATLLFLVGCSEKKDKKQVAPKEVIQKVQVHTMSKVAYPIWVNFSGKTDAFKTVNVVARVKGELEKRYFKAGDLVKIGDVLFHIEDTEYKSLLAQAQAGLKKNQASQRLSVATYNRYKPLVEKDLAPREQLDQLEAEVHQYDAMILSDEASIKKAKLDLFYTDVKATIDGQIGKQIIDTGNTVGTTSDNSSLAKIVQSNPLYVNFFPSNEIAQTILRYKSEKEPRVVINVSTGNNQTKEYFGNVDFIDNTTDNTTGTVNFRAKIDNPKYQLLPGTFVEIEMFITDQVPVLAVSPNNVMEDQLGSFVYVVTEQNILEKRHFEISFGNKDLLIIKGSVENSKTKFKDTIKETDKVVTSSMVKLRPGLKVEATETKNPVEL